MAENSQAQADSVADQDKKETSVPEDSTPLGGDLATESGAASEGSTGGEANDSGLTSEGSARAEAVTMGTAPGVPVSQSESPASDPGVSSGGSTIQPGCDATNLGTTAEGSVPNATSQATESVAHTDAETPDVGKKSAESTSGASGRATPSAKTLPMPPTDDMPRTSNDRRQAQRKATHQDANELPYIHSSLMVGRHIDKAVIVIVGTTGHGKSKTINRLVGHNLLEVGSPIGGSTTKVVQRVAVPMHDPRTGVTITLAFDDTPGGEDTTYTDRARNAVLMHRYSRIHFAEPEQNSVEITDIGSPAKPELRRRKYPNAILLVAKWESIKEDAHNDPQHFTSPIGKTMLNLSISNLVDFERANVIVVVTRSLSSWDEYEDDKNEEEKNKHWIADARKKTLIIEALQRKLFTGSRLWRVVFIENGGGQSVLKIHRSLPNGELSHQNLFDAIRRLFDSVDDKTMPKDLVGIHALALLTGAESLRPHFEQRRVEVLCKMEPSEIISEQEKASIGLGTNDILPLPSPITPASPISDQLLAIANNILGLTYNPIFGTYGRSCVLELNQSTVHIDKYATRQFEQITRSMDTEEHAKYTARQLRADFRMREVAGLSSHYSSYNKLQSAVSSESHSYVANKLTAVAKVLPLRPRLTAEMLSVIEKLPRWKDETKAEYENFFQSHGTHVVLCAALGGVLRIIVQGDTAMDEATVKRVLEADADVPGLAQLADIGLGARREKSRDSRKVIGKAQVTVCRDGGGAVASELSRALETLFSPHRTPSMSLQPSDWSDVRMRWMDALETDSVFCPDGPDTTFEWLYNCDGLTPSQQLDLQLASKAYLQADAATSAVPPSPQRNYFEELPRKQNLKKANSTLDHASLRWKIRFSPWIRFKFWE